MIWSQDGDPRQNIYFDTVEDRPVMQALLSSAWPTCYELWWFTAHEQADTVVQILCGQGITYGLGGTGCNTAVVYEPMHTIERPYLRVRAVAAPRTRRRSFQADTNATANWSSMGAGLL